jgi:paired amphipathic helix protein Sin3a
MLIQGFNTFLPVGYRIECSTDPHQSAMITVTTPSGTMLQSTRDEPTGSGGSQSPFPRIDGPAAVSPNTLPPDPSMYGMGLDSVSIEPAVQYVQKIKQRCDEATYRHFLEILGRYHNMAETVDEASPFCAHICHLKVIE